jgi:predicted P-loop ATPase
MDRDQIAQLAGIFSPIERAEDNVLSQLERTPDRIERDHSGREVILERGRPLKHKLNIYRIMELDSRLRDRYRYNEFADEIWDGDHLLEDHHITELSLWLQRIYRVTIGKEPLYDLIIRRSRENAYHPLQDYLQSLKWDGKKRIGQILQRYWGVEDTPLLREIGLRWAISCVARGLRPGCKVDTVLILCGPQGAKKSTSLRVLAGDGYFSDSHLDIRSKDSYQLIHQSGVWIWELAEFYSLKNRDNENAKMFLSSPSDRYRPSYAKAPVNRKRSLVFTSTTNELAFLTDSTGNRRYWPVNTEIIDIEGLKKDRDQIWAEAVSMFKSGEIWWLEGSHEMDLQEYQKSFVVDDPWSHAIQELLAEFPDAGVLMDQIFDRLGLEKPYRNSGYARRITAILQGLGAEQLRPSSHPMTNQKRPRVWRLKHD